MLRPVPLPPGVPGNLFLSGMPGYYDSFFEERDLIVAAGVQTVFCLPPMEEIRRKSPVYARAIEAGELPWEMRHFPIEDLSVPDDEEAFVALAREAADDLRAGQRVMIHCTAGIGRTGLLAVCVLMALGMSRDAAVQAVHSAGSDAEMPAQRALIRRVARIFEGKDESQP